MASETGPLANPSSLACAVHALKREFFAFDFDYPLEEDPDAGPAGSLHYYLYSNRLKWEHLRMSPDGVPQTWTRTTGTNYWPAYVAWYGLVHLGSYVRGLGCHHADIFRKQVNWLLTRAEIRPDGAAVWPMHFDYPDCGIVLRKPWISAHAQGLVMSALVRAWWLDGAQPWLAELIEKSPRAFGLNVEQCGVREIVDGSCFYTETPGGPVPGILDGFITSLLGLYDVYTATGDLKTKNLFLAGVEGLSRLLPYWDYRGKWSWYGHRERLCPPQYHCLNRLLLKALGRITCVSEFDNYADRWHHENLSRLDRTEIHMGYILTQNMARIRQRTWAHETIASRNGHVRSAGTT